MSFHSTHIQVVGFDNQPFSRTSCGTEGFQNAKKGTAIAAQTAAMAAAVVSLHPGFPAPEGALPACPHTWAQRQLSRAVPWCWSSSRVSFAHRQSVFERAVRNAPRVS